MKKSSFFLNCMQLFHSEKSEEFINLCFEFMNGGDGFYGSHSPIDMETWNQLTLEKKAEIAEETLNRPELILRYPGTFSGPRSEHLSILHGLDKLISFSCDSMMVTTYKHLLEIPNLERISVDIFGHTVGYFDQEWCVFDALIFTQSKDYRANLEGLKKYQIELDLKKPFKNLQNENSQKNVKDDRQVRDEMLNFITLDYLYQNFQL